MTPFKSTAVERAFAAYPPAMRKQLLALRALIFETAAATDGVGPLEEVLKWGDPAYVTASSRSGSTIRLGWKQRNPSQYALYVNCQTDLVDTFKTLFPGEFRFEGHRAIVFHESDAVPTDCLGLCITAALTYHRDKPGRTARTESRTRPRSVRP